MKNEVDQYVRVTVAYATDPPDDHDENIMGDTPGWAKIHHIEEYRVYVVWLDRDETRAPFLCQYDTYEVIPRGEEPDELIAAIARYQLLGGEVHGED